MDIWPHPWMAALGGWAAAVAAFACERSVRTYPWTRVEEVDDRPRRQRMEYSLEHADAVTTACVVLGGAALCVMALGLLQLLGSGRGGSLLPAASWVVPAVVLALTLIATWIAPSLWAKFFPEAFVAYWVPLVGRALAWPFRREGVGNGEGAADDQGPDEEDDAEEEAREVFRSLLRLATVTASEIMTPRTNMVFVRDSATVAEVFEAAEASGHSRLPVFHGTRDQIVGVVYVKDLLNRLRDPNWKAAPIAELARKPFFVPETKRVDELLEEFQRSKVHLGVVLDEYGGTAGLITLEDILEEILGEIRDEHDPDEVRQVHQVDEGAYELDAMARVEDVNDAINVNLPEDEDFDTVAGYVSFRLGRLPRAGETFEGDGVRITVLEGDVRRVKRVRLDVLNGRG